MGNSKIVTISLFLEFCTFYVSLRFMQVNSLQSSPLGSDFWLVKIVWYVLSDFKNRRIFPSSSSANMSSMRRMIDELQNFCKKATSISLRERSRSFISHRERYFGASMVFSFVFWISMTKSSRCGPIWVCPVRISLSLFSLR